MPRPPLKPCGTYAAYYRHIDNGNPPCDTCREAVSRLGKERRELQKNKPANELTAEQRILNNCEKVWQGYLEYQKKISKL